MSQESLDPEPLIFPSDQEFDLIDIGTDVGSGTHPKANGASKAKPQVASIANVGSDYQIAAFPDDGREMQQIHRTFSNVLSDFEGDTSAERFIAEYKKLYEALRESHKQQRHYMLRCANLQSDIKNNAEKVNLALHLSREDREVINNLNQQVKQAWNEVENMSEKESRAKRAIQALQQEVQVLMMMVESSMGIEELGKMAEKSSQEHTELEVAFTELREELEFKEVKLHEAQERIKLKDEIFFEDMKKKDDKLAHFGDKNKDMQMRMDEMDISLKRLETLRNYMMQENSQMMSDGEIQNRKVNSLEHEMANMKSKLEETTTHFRKQKIDNQAKMKELQQLSKHLLKMRKLNEAHNMLIQNLHTELNLANLDLKVAHKELYQKQRECNTLGQRLYRGMELKGSCERDMLEKERELQRERSQLNKLQTEMFGMQKQMNLLQKRLNHFVSANEAASRVHIKVTNRNKEVEASLKIQQSANDNLVAEVNKMTSEMKAAMTCINSLDADKKRLFGRINQAISMVNKLNDEIDTKDNLLLTLDQVNQFIGGQLKNTKTSFVLMTNKCDSAKNDLHFSEIKNESLFLANNNYNKQSLTLAEDLLNKEKEITLLQQNFETLKQNMDKQQTEMIAIISQNNQTKLKVKEMESTIYHLEHLLCDKEGRILELNRNVEKLISQRNIISLNCVRKMEEIGHLSDKNAVLEDIVKIGNNQYDKRLSDIQFLKLQIMDLYRQKDNVMNKLENVDNLKSKIALANQQLVNAKARYRALEDEHPYNLHRWRNLEAKEISQYEMVIKIQFLLKRLINKTDEVTKLESTVIGKNIIIKELQKILKRRPGVDDVRKAHSHVVANRDLEKKMKAILAEKNLAEWQSEERKKEKEDLRKKLNVEQQQSNRLQKSKQKLLTITSRFPGIGRIAEQSPKCFGPACGNGLGKMTNLLPKI